MNRRTDRTTAATLAFPLLTALVLAAGCGPSSPVLPSAPPEDQQMSQAEDSSLSSTTLQLTLPGLLTCYATALDELGVGENAAGTARLRTCFTPDARLSFQFPPPLAALNFEATGPTAFAEHVIGIFEANGFVRTQHNVSNVVITRTGSSTAVMRSYISAPHVFADESSLNLTAMFVDDVRRESDGRWLITRRQGVVTSASHWPAVGQ